MEAVLAKYNPVQKATLSVDASTGKLILYGAGTKNIPAAVYLVDLEISSGGDPSQRRRLSHPVERQFG